MPPAELSHAAQEAADLAQWTGRLSHADPPPALTPQPARQRRPPQQLAPDPGAFTRTLIAVHQAAITISALATAGYSQIRAAARNGRLLVPAVQIPGPAHDPRTYARAPRSDLNILLAAYRDAGTASIKATASLSRITAQHEAAAGGHHARGHLLSAAITNRGEDQPPGPIERIVYGLGITQPDLLSRATALDKSVSQLIADAADQTAPQRWHSAVTRPDAVTNQLAVTRQVLATGQHAPARTLHTSLRTLAVSDPQAQPELRNRSRRHAARPVQPAPPALPRAA